jgi:hypothetical protein
MPQSSKIYMGLPRHGIVDTKPLLGVTVVSVMSCSTCSFHLLSPTERGTKPPSPGPRPCLAGALDR